MKPDTPELINQLSDLPKDFLAALKEAAKKSNIERIAIIGGVIRDQLIHEIHKKPLSKLRDIDLIVEGSVEDLAKHIQRFLGAERVSILNPFNSYQTLQLKIDNLTIDLARAREELYKLPGENPQVTESTIEKDLKRRDFTVNAIALEIMSNSLIDIHKGCESVCKRELKLLHSKSITEDPTRVIRAARYSTRVSFNLDKDSLDQIQSTLIAWPWGWGPSDNPEKAPPALSSRLRMELNLLFQKEDWKAAVSMLQSWGALVLIDEQLQKDKHWERRINWLLKHDVEILTGFIAGAKSPPLLSRRLQLSDYQTKILIQVEEIKVYADKLIKWNNKLNLLPSTWTEEIESRSWDPKAIAIAIALGVPTWKSFLRWLRRWRLVKSPINANTLLEKGWEPGPKLGEELKKQRLNKLNKKYSD